MNNFMRRRRQTYIDDIVSYGYYEEEQQASLEERVAIIMAKAPVAVWQDYNPTSGYWYQDAAGTIKGTAVAQPTGLLLDRSKGGFGPEQAKPPTDPAWTLAATITPSGNGFQFTEAPTGSFATIPINITNAGTSKLAFKITGRTTGRLRIHVAGSATSYSSPSYTANGDYTRIIKLVNTTAFPNLLRLEAYTTDGSLTNLKVEVSLMDAPGNHESQPTAGSRSIMRQDAGGFYYRQFDGVDDWGSIPALNMSMTNKARVYMGLVLDAIDSSAVVIELDSHVGVTEGTFRGVMSSNDQIAWSVKGTTDVQMLSTDPFELGKKYVLKGLGDISAPKTSVQMNGLPLMESTSSLGTGNFNTHPLWVGARGDGVGGTFPFTGKIYSLIVVGGDITPEEHAALTEYVNSKIGAF